MSSALGWLSVVVGVGASLDFIAGAQRRAPRWMSESGSSGRTGSRRIRNAWRAATCFDPQFVGIVAKQMLSPAAAS